MIITFLTMEFHTDNDQAFCQFLTLFSGVGSFKGSWSSSFYIITSVSILLNLLLVYGLHKTSRPFSKVTLLFVYLSCLDCTSCMLSLVELAFDQPNVKISCMLYGVVSSINSVLFALQLLTLCSVSLQRFLSIRRPLARVASSKKPLVLSLIVEFLIAFSTGATLFVLGQLKLSDSILTVLMLLTDFLNLLFLGFVLVLNILSYVVLRKKASVNNYPSNRTDSTVSTTRSMANQRDALKTLLIITFFYCICCLPLMLLFIVHTLSSDVDTFLDSITEIAFDLYYANTGINSLIYILRTKKIRRRIFLC